MLPYLLDTDHVTLLLQGHAPLGRRLALQPAGAVGLSVVSVEELCGADWLKSLVPMTDRGGSTFTHH